MATRKQLMEKIDAILKSKKVIREADEDEISTGATPEGGEFDAGGDEYNPESDVEAEADTLSSWVAGVESSLDPAVVEEIKSFIQFKMENTGTTEDEGTEDEFGDEEEVKEEDIEIEIKDEEDEDEYGVKAESFMSASQKKAVAKAKRK